MTRFAVLTLLLWTFAIVGCEPAPAPDATPDTPSEGLGGGSDAPPVDPPAQPDEPPVEGGSATSNDDAEVPTLPGPEEASTTPAEVPGSADEPIEVALVDESNESAANSTSAKPVAKKDITSGDWPMWGGSIERNMVNPTTDVSLDIEPAESAEDGKNLLWVRELGSQTYGNPVVAEGYVVVGTNNGGGYRPAHPKTEDRGVVLCFRESDGEFRWQLTREKLSQGRVNDWPEQGICSTPVIEDGIMYVVTNRAELMAVDMEGFYDDENDGPITDEPDTDKLDADILWSLDLINELGVFPHNLATSSPVLHGDSIFIVTSNGVDEAHLEIPAPRAPSFVSVNKKSGELEWEDNTPFDQILHGQWASPAIATVNGEPQILMPGGDGYLYAFAKTGDEEGFGDILWKFDLNPKDSKWELGGRGTRNNIVSTPVVIGSSVILSVGQDPEHGEGVGHIYRIDATKSGDISPQIADGEGGFKENPNSGEIWHWGGVDEDGSITGRKGELLYRRTISTVAVHDGLVIAPDLSGFVHCLDFETGKRYWEYDMFAACWGSPMVVDGKVLIGDEDGDLTVLPLDRELPDEEPLAEILFNSSIYSTPTIANGRMYVSDRSRLYAFQIK
ncbi:outer membrane protein assembly factor BamB family protein [Stratiformator vulcanicus]|uniref:Outer membrane biogenesis protein BamB n=1 Tax=Stratiformator vulcanicus TaxID=2527980 RepID=A0A517R2Z2_9PLAN|nr:PQQ-binding-like beta-propeller repeat protein [Stratiformator vulcanicus]QDT38213.1 outer membrane biogenesis protein BamB [Stratiformator vulcanicus]